VVDVGHEDGVGQMAIYLDDMASGTTVTGNVVHEVNRAFMVGGGRDNRVTNNLAVNVDEPIQFDARVSGGPTTSAKTRTAHSR